MSKNKKRINSQNSRPAANKPIAFRPDETAVLVLEQAEKRFGQYGFDRTEFINESIAHRGLTLKLLPVERELKEPR